MKAETRGKKKYKHGLLMRLFEFQVSRNSSRSSERKFKKHENKNAAPGKASRIATEEECSPREQSSMKIDKWKNKTEEGRSGQQRKQQWQQQKRNAQPVEAVRNNKI